MNRHRDMVANLRTKVNQMASTLNMSNFANRDSLLGPEIKPADAMRRTEGLDNHGIVGLQWQIMKEQDEGLEKLEETVTSTKHIALAVNEELDLHIRLIDDLDQHVDVTDSRLRIAEGNMWLNDNIGVVPKNSWAIDPFGYSATMAYLSAVWVSRTCLFRGLIMR
ncbi:syntaxin-51 isoform X2 [Manihot esculenta]|uniref:syntaxin-51 isoform X2 n=1 Tax=Manihot esculenta TaxID=3983 RepID=UPI001CC44019|nr:syntaxin-51 isoform X2 [Manihot esculenta]